MDARPGATALDLGRAAFARSAWREAHEQLSAANQQAALLPDDLEQLGTAAYLIGKDEESIETLTRLNHVCLEQGLVEGAVRAAFWLGLSLVSKGEQARGGGWLMRAQRLLEENKLDSVYRGYLLFPQALRTITGDDPAAGVRILGEAIEIGVRFGDRSLVALARQGQGRALIKMGDAPRGVALLDEAMASIEAGDVSPLIAGNVYCSVIEACSELYDIRRAQEWTSSLTRWCEAQPDLVPFRGQCLIRRSELMQFYGDWDNALLEAQRARARLSEPPPPHSAVGAAWYQEAELHRLRGEFAEAEQAYRAASQWTRKPRPGLALLRLAQGQKDSAVAIAGGLLEEATREGRAEVLAAWNEIALASADLKAAREAANELAQIAAQADAPLLSARAAYADASTLAAEADARASMTAARRAWMLFQEIEAPYHAARARVLVGCAARALGDHDAAAMEWDAARLVFEQLGALPDVARTDELTRTIMKQSVGGLTAREVQVLRLLAQGKTNKAIAGELFISEKTVHRHVANIFLKLDLSTRAGATAYAFQHGLA
jgi:DNA-binding CsgD family transcriptional regulator